MELNKKQAYLIQWLIGMGDLFIINLVFLVVVYVMSDYYVTPIFGKIREVVLLLNFCYLFALTFAPLQLHESVIFIEKIAQRSFLLITIHLLLFITCLIFLNLGDSLATFLVVYYIASILSFTSWRIFVRITLKLYRRKGHNSKRIVIVGAGKNGLDLYQVMKNDLAYGFDIAGFFDDNVSLKYSLPNYLGMTHEVEDYLVQNEIDEVYCTLPGTQDAKILRILNFAEKNMIRFYIVPELYRNVKKVWCWK